MHLEILVEDSSGKRLLDHLLPRIIGSYGAPHTYRVHSYRGIGRIPKNLSSNGDPQKRILLEQLPKILRGYAETSGIDAVVVVLDSDRNNCRAFLNDLHDLAVSTGLPNTMFRIAIEEIEAWYFGDRNAIRTAYPRAKLDLARTYAQDSVCGTWELLADVVFPGGRKAVAKVGWPLPGQLKHEWAENIGSRLDIEGNESPSFQKLVEGLRRIVEPTKRR